MTTFTKFETPGLLSELSAEALESWSVTMTDHTAQFASRFGRYFDPTAPDASAEVTSATIVWSASPARLLVELTDRERWATADSTRDQQDEYCEWRTTRDTHGRLTSVVFSTEVPEYWDHIAENDRELLVALYREHVDPGVLEADLFDVEGIYKRNNKWNNATSVGMAHLRQQSNTLLAALDLAAEATVQRADASGRRVEDRRELVACGHLGEPLRNSDPQIADIINDTVAAGSAVTLATPLGLYLDRLQSASFRTPDGTDPATFWTPIRGAEGHVVRARFEVPSELEYVLADVTVDGRPLEFGTQVADKVRIRIDALVTDSAVPLTTMPCGL